MKPETLVVVALIAFAGALVPTHAGEWGEDGRVIRAYRAYVTPAIDGRIAPGEWNDAIFYTFTWSPEEQNVTLLSHHNFTQGLNGERITPYTLRLRVAFKYEDTRLFMVAEINDDDYHKWDMIALIFESNNDPSDAEKGHLAIVADNASYPLGAFGVYEADGSLWFCYCAPDYNPDAPVNCTFEPGRGYVFEAIFNLEWLNLSSPLKLNVVYWNIVPKPHFLAKQISIVPTLDTDRYYRFVLVDDFSGGIYLPFASAIAVVTGTAVIVHMRLVRKNAITRSQGHSNPLKTF